jgi:class 3 adenylate cyclase
MEVVHMLSTVVGEFDALATERQVVRIPVPVEDHADRPLWFGARIHEALATLSAENFDDWGFLQLRVGMHSGHVIGAMLSRQRWSYDVLGQVPHVATQLEQSAPVGGILASTATFMMLSPFWAAQMVPSEITNQQGGTQRATYEYHPRWEDEMAAAVTQSSGRGLRGCRSCRRARRC